MGDLLRTKAMADKYQAHRASDAFGRSCALCEAEALKSFNFWKIIPNSFPYDLIAEKHDMIVPLRHVTEDDLTDEERVEYLQIKKQHLGEYDYLIEATQKNKSIPAHFHIHLIVRKGAMQTQS